MFERSRPFLRWDRQVSTGNRDHIAQNRSPRSFSRPTNCDEIHRSFSSKRLQLQGSRSGLSLPPYDWPSSFSHGEPRMKALLFAAIAAVAGVSYVGYSYSATDGKSCLVCPMTGEPIFTSTESSSDGPCCAGGDLATLTSLSGEPSSCCKNSSNCENESTDSILTSASNPECTGQCDKGCCKDKEPTIDDNSGT